jgi:hypothetical protein
MMTREILRRRLEIVNWLTQENTNDTKITKKIHNPSAIICAHLRLDLSVIISFICGAYFFFVFLCGWILIQYEHVRCICIRWPVDRRDDRL